MTYKHVALIDLTSDSSCFFVVDFFPMQATFKHTSYIPVLLNWAFISKIYLAIQPKQVLLDLIFFNSQKW